jgi:DNA-binding MarR family transcriptional regulator
VPVSVKQREKKSARSPRTSRSLHKSLPTSESLGYTIREAHRAFTRSLEARIGKHGITSGMWWFLRLLWTQDGLTQAELSERLKVMGPTTVRAMDRLEKFGLIRREPSSEDKRKVFIYLTERGRELEAQLMDYALEVQEVGSRGMSADEVRMLRSLLQRALHSLADDQTSEASN